MGDRVDSWFLLVDLLFIFLFCILRTFSNCLFELIWGGVIGGVSYGWHSSSWFIGLGAVKSFGTRLVTARRHFMMFVLVVVSWFVSGLVPHGLSSPFRSNYYSALSDVRIIVSSV